MDDHQALAVVTALAHGANPQTGEVFSNESMYQTPDVIRALFVAQRALEAKLASARPIAKAVADKLSREVGSHAAPNPSNATEKIPQKVGADRSRNIGKPWTSEEDARLLKAFDSKQSAEEIARLHGRSPSGIRARLEKHGRLEPSSTWPAKRVEQR